MSATIRDPQLNTAAENNPLNGLPYYGLHSLMPGLRHFAPNDFRLVRLKPRLYHCRYRMIDHPDKL